MLQILNRHALKLLVTWILVLSLFYSTLSILRHSHFQSGGFDLGLYDQAVWKYSQRLGFYNTVKERHILGDHLTLTLPLLAPLFWVWNDVRALLIFQAFWLSFSSLVVFKLVRHRGFSGLTALNLSFAYSFFYGLQFLVFFDFHPVAIGVGLIPWFVYLLESGQKRPAFLAGALLLLTQENMGLALAGLGLIYLFDHQRRQLAAGFIIGGFAYSFLAARVIAHFSNIGFQYWPAISLNPFHLAADFFNSQEKRLTWLYSLGWFSLLPLFSSGAMLAVILDLAQYFVTGPEFARMWSPFMHHRGILAPFLLLGTLETFGRLKRRKTNLQFISLLMVAATLAQQYFFHFPLNKLSKKIYWQEEPWMTDNRELITTIPADTSIATQQNLVPHLSHREEIYLVWPREHDFTPPPCGQQTCWWLDFGGQPEYLIVDLRPRQWLTQTLEQTENFVAAVANMEATGKISLAREINHAKLYKIHY